MGRRGVPPEVTRLLFPLEALLSGLVWVGVSIATILFTLLMLPLYGLRPLLDPDLRMAHEVSGLWGRFLIRMAPGCRVKVWGREHLERLPPGRPVILMANHQSYVDVPILYFLRWQFKWLADEALFQIPFFGWSMRMAGYVPVRRGDADQARWALEQARHWLSRGISIFVFPEGTRSHTGTFGRFQSGGFRLAIATKSPILPVVMIGTRQLLPRGSWFFRIGVIPQIHILPPIVPTGNLDQVHRLARKVRAEMEKVYAQHLKELR